MAIGGWSIQYAAATGSNWSKTDIPAGVMLAPGQYYLVQQSSGGSVGAALPALNASGSITMQAAPARSP